MDAGTSLEASVKEAIDLIGWRPSRGERYLLKPNMIVAKTSEEGVTTDPGIIGALISLLKGNGCQPYVGDSPGNAYPGKARSVFEKTGMLRAVSEAGGEFVEFESSPPLVVGTGGKIIREVGLAEPIFRMGLINVPKLKTHIQTVMTGAVKNLSFGCIPGSGKIALHMEGRTMALMAEAMIDVYSVIRPLVTLNVMDAIVCMEGAGPSHGRPVRVGKVLASRDALALDMVAFKMAGVDPLKVPYIKEAAVRSMGPRSPDEIEVLGDLPSLKFRLPPAFLGRFLLLASPYAPIKSTVSISSSCKRCGECARACPVSVISLYPSPRIDSGKCLRCFVCSEVCEYGAVRIRKGFASGFM